MSYNRKYNTDSLEHPLRFVQNSSGTSALKPTASEFTPLVAPKFLNPSAQDFKPEYSKADLKADAPAFVLTPDPIKILSTSYEFIPEKLPDEKFDEPIFMISNRELTEEDLNLEIIDEVVKVDVKNIYHYEEILNIYKSMRQNPNFEKISDDIKRFGNRVIYNIRSKSQHKKNKENLKSKVDWRENEDLEIVSSTVWRKPKTQEEEKIIEKAKIYKAKLSGTKEEHEKIKRQIKTTLNKLSPTNLDKLKEQLLDIGKESTNNLIFLVQCIFEKAWSEVKYTQMYANLCKFLKEKFENYTFDSMEPNPNPSQNFNLFKRELLDRCESSFVQNSIEDLSGLSEEEIDQKRSQLKKKTLGNVRFIGELFKVSLVTSKIILKCVNELISKENIDEDKLEGACILLSTGGSSFERSKLIKSTDEIFKELKSIMAKDSLSSKSKFKIMVTSI
jgi:translation initiation factor 4G